MAGDCGRTAAAQHAVEHGGFDAAPWKLTRGEPAAGFALSGLPGDGASAGERGIVPDFEGEGMRAIHRRDGDEEMYFIANREGPRERGDMRVSRKRQAAGVVGRGDRRASRAGDSLRKGKGGRIVPVRLRRA